MQEVSVIIPNFNGMAYLDGVLAGLECQTVSNFDVILVDNGSNDGSCAFVAARYPWVHLIELPENFGFCKAVNEGIRASRSPYVLLLNNDIEVTENFIEEMLSAIKRHPKAFSCAARMIQFHDRDRLDDAGNYYCALGWAYARGKGKDIHTYEKEEKIFASCAGAAIYRKKIFDELGYFDEEHFAYLEDMDVGYRARIYGYENWYAPDAMVYHVGSGTSGSRYNQFKIRYSSRKVNRPRSLLCLDPFVHRVDAFREIRKTHFDPVLHGTARKGVRAQKLRTQDFRRRRQGVRQVAQATSSPGSNIL